MWIEAAEGSARPRPVAAGWPGLQVASSNRGAAGTAAGDRSSELHALADALALSDARVFEVALDAINDWMTARLNIVQHDKAKAARPADVWQEINSAARTTDIYNLDRKPLIFRAFARLAEPHAADGPRPSPPLPRYFSSGCCRGLRSGQADLNLESCRSDRHRLNIQCRPNPADYLDRLRFPIPTGAAHSATPMRRLPTDAIARFRCGLIAATSIS